MPGIGGQDMHHMLDLLWACRSYSFWVSPSGQAAWTRTSKDIPSSINGLPLDQAHLADSCRFYWWPTPFFVARKISLEGCMIFLGGARCTWARSNDGWTLCGKGTHTQFTVFDGRPATKMCGGFWSLHIVTSCDGFFWQLRIQFFYFIDWGISLARLRQEPGKLPTSWGQPAEFLTWGVASLSRA